MDYKEVYNKKYIEKISSFQKISKERGEDLLLISFTDFQSIQDFYLELINDLQNDYIEIPTIISKLKTIFSLSSQVEQSEMSSFICSTEILSLLIHYLSDQNTFPDIIYLISSIFAVYTYSSNEICLSLYQNGIIDSIIFIFQRTYDSHGHCFNFEIESQHRNNCFSHLVYTLGNIFIFGKNQNILSDELFQYLLIKRCNKKFG